MQLEIDNFAKAWMTDAELDSDKLYSFLTFINSDIDFERGSSVRRPGYNRHNTTSLTGTPKQFYSFTNLAGETRELVIAYDPAATAHAHVFVLSGGIGYEIRNYSTSPTTILVFDSRDNYPFITVGNRVFFADDNGWFWSDYSSLVKGADPYTYECYQVGIDKPDWDVFTTRKLQGAGKVGYIPGAGSLQNLEPDTGTYRRLAQSFQISYPMELDAITLNLTKNWVSGKAARARVSIHTDDSGYPASAILAEAFVEIEDIAAGATNVHFSFDIADRPSIAISTTYWCVLDGDTGYDDNYNAATDRIAWLYNPGNPYASGKAAYYDGSWHDFATNDFYISLGGWLDTSAAYKYVFTYYNDTHNIESQLHDDYAFINTTASQWSVEISDLDWPDDEQVSHIRAYRTEGGGTTYKYVGQIVSGITTWIDSVADENLGGELQTGGDLIAAKHLRLQDADGNLIVPYLLEIWNGRIWAVKFHDNVLNYSKMLEEAGATGIAGDSIYDYFPADNKWTLDSEIRSIRKRGEDEFVVYTSNNNVHVFRGGSDALNPPPDLTRQEMLIGANAWDDRTLQEVRGRHIFLTSDKEIKAFNGTVDLEELGDAISSFLLQNGTKFSSCMYKNQYCLGCDADSDNIMDSIIIFDLSQPRITNWRRYQYLNSYGATGDLMKFYNLFVTRDARMFACPADLDTNAFYVVQLMTGYSDDWTNAWDDGVDITRIIQTQFIIPARRARWTRVELSCFYPHGMYYGTDFYGSGMYGGVETMPTYIIYAVGKSDEFCQTTIAPKSSRDITGHVAGIRLLSEECSVRIEDTGDKLDEIRSLTLHWSFN